MNYKSLSCLNNSRIGNWYLDVSNNNYYTIIKIEKRVLNKSFKPRLYFYITSSGWYISCTENDLFEKIGVCNDIDQIISIIKEQIKKAESVK